MSIGPGRLVLWTSAGLSKSKSMPAGYGVEGLQLWFVFQRLFLTSGRSGLSSVSDCQCSGTSGHENTAQKSIDFIRVVSRLWVMNVCSISMALITVLDPIASYRCSHHSTFEYIIPGSTDENAWRRVHGLVEFTGGCTLTVRDSGWH